MRIKWAFQIAVIFLIGTVTTVVMYLGIWLAYALGVMLSGKVLNGLARLLCTRSIERKGKLIALLTFLVGLHFDLLAS